MTRHDLTKTDRDLINLTVTLGFTDAVEVACEMVRLEGDVEMLLIELVLCVGSYQHDADMAEKRSQWFDAYNARCAAKRAA